MTFPRNIVQLLLLSVTMTNALSALFYVHTVYIYIGCVVCVIMTISMSLARWNVKINYKLRIANYNISLKLSGYVLQFARY